MNELVVIKDNDVFTDSLVIAKGTENEHKSIIRSIFNYEDKFKKFENIRFSDLKSPNLIGGF